MNEVEELFRNPNLLIKSIREIQQKQETALNEIQLKLNQITKIKGNLEATNYFQPNSSSFDQKAISLFGSIK